MPMAFDWYQELAWIKEYRFPLDQESKTVYECLKDWMDDYNGHIEATSFLTDDEKRQIREFSDSLLQSYELSLNGNDDEVLSAFKQAMDKVRNYLWTISIGYEKEYSNIEMSYYRILPGKNEFDYKNMLHRPLTLPESEAANRFGSKGTECTYMASSAEVAWYEMRRPEVFQVACFMAVNTRKKILRLDIHPQQSVRELLSVKDRMQWNEKEMKLYATKLCYTLPLVAACSVSVIDKGAKPVAAYIIPHLVMKWVKGNTDYLGVRYASKVPLEDKKNEKIKKETGYNLALLIGNTDSDGFSIELQNVFGVVYPEGVNTAPINDDPRAVRETVPHRTQEDIQKHIL